MEWTVLMVDTIKQSANIKYVLKCSYSYGNVVKMYIWLPWRMYCDGRPICAAYELNVRKYLSDRNVWNRYKRWNHASVLAKGISQACFSLIVIHDIVMPQLTATEATTSFSRCLGIKPWQLILLLNILLFAQGCVTGQY